MIRKERYRSTGFLSCTHLQRCRRQNELLIAEARARAASVSRAVRAPTPRRRDGLRDLLNGRLNWLVSLMVSWNTALDTTSAAREGITSPLSDNNKDNTDTKLPQSPLSCSARPYIVLASLFVRLIFLWGEKREVDHPRGPTRRPSFRSEKPLGMSLRPETAGGDHCYTP